MAKTWVLDTETKGTGAEMVPLERLEKKLRSRGVRPAISPKRKPPPAPAPEARAPWRFKVVDVVSRSVLAEDADARTTLEVLRGTRSIVDVRIYVWRPKEGEWELLTFDERKILWDLREADAA
jgi:hypothetical protein